MNELDLLATEAIPTSPKENPMPDVLSALRFPDWVENAKREKKRQEAAVSQFFKLDEIANWLDLLEDENARTFCPVAPPRRGWVTHDDACWRAWSR